MSAQPDFLDPDQDAEERRKWFSPEAIAHFKAKYPEEPREGWDDDDDDDNDGG